MAAELACNRGETEAMKYQGEEKQRENKFSNLGESEVKNLEKKSDDNREKGKEKEAITDHGEEDEKLQCHDSSDSNSKSGSKNNSDNSNSGSGSKSGSQSGSSDKGKSKVKALRKNHKKRGLKKKAIEPTSNATVVGSEEDKLECHSNNSNSHSGAESDSGSESKSVSGNKSDSESKAEVEENKIAVAEDAIGVKDARNMEKASAAIKQN